MKYAVVLFIANACLAQVKIKGHQIGENAADFLKTEPTIQSTLGDCHANRPRQLSVDEVKQRKFPDGINRTGTPGSCI